MKNTTRYATNFLCLYTKWKWKRKHTNIELYQTIKTECRIRISLNSYRCYNILKRCSSLCVCLFVFFSHYFYIIKCLKVKRNVVYLFEKWIELSESYSIGSIERIRCNISTKTVSTVKNCWMCVILSAERSRFERFDNNRPVHMS